MTDDESGVTLNVVLRNAGIRDGAKIALHLATADRASHEGFLQEANGLLGETLSLPGIEDATLEALADRVAHIVAGCVSVSSWALEAAALARGATTDDEIREARNRIMLEIERDLERIYPDV